MASGEKARDLVGSGRLDIAAELKSVYFIENAHSGLLKSRDVVVGCPMSVYDCCKYSGPYRKRTSIWTDSGRILLRGPCKYDCPHKAPNRIS